MQTKFDNLNKQSGFWFEPAFFNHSCLSNCLVNTCGDLILFYAQRDIQKGEELTIRYFPAEWSLEEKKERAQLVYGFTCDCPLCKMDTEDPMRPSREKLLTQIEAQTGNNMNEALKNLQKMKCTYLKRPNYQFHLISPLQSLATCYRSVLNYINSVKCYEDVFELIKDHNDFVAVTMLKETLKDYKRSPQSAKKIEACKKIAFDYFESIKFSKFYYEKLWQKMLQLS